VEFIGAVDASGKLDPDVRVQVADYLRTFPNMRVSIRVGQQKRQRSLDQNAYLHAEPFPTLAKIWGESIARTKLICMGEFWGWEPCKVTQCMLPVKAHTSDMSVEECTLFINWLIPWAAEEHGVEIRLPEEWEGRGHHDAARDVEALGMAGREATRRTSHSGHGDRQGWR
jgi:hypothetical protein